MITEFRVAGVDAEFQRLTPLGCEFVQKPTTMPWGNRSLLVRDTDGNLINFFTPVTPDAVQRQVRRGRARCRPTFRYPEDFAVSPTRVG